MLNFLKDFWGEALYTSNYLQNRSPSKATLNITPYERWYGISPNLSYLKIFGCKAHVLVPKEQRQKLDSHSFEALFLGYSEESKAYRLLNIKTHKLIISRDVIFNEQFSPHIQSHSFPEDTDSDILIDPKIFQHQPSSIPPLSQTPLLPQPPILSQLSGESSMPQNSLSPPGPSFSNSSNHQTSQHDNDGASNTKTHLSNLKSYHNAGLPFSDEATSKLQPPYAPLSSLARPVRTKKPTQKLLDSIAGQSSTKSSHSKRHQANVVTHSMDPPQTYQDAISRSDSPQWQASINAEFDSLHKNNTWIITPLPPNRKPITSKWIFKIKTKADGTLDKYKARLVARRFTQIAGIDYNETFIELHDVT